MPMPAARCALMSLLIALSGTAMAGDPMAAAGSPPAPVALVTGSDRGIGRALTEELVARGWHVIATCRDPEHATDLKAFAAAHPAVSIERLDVADNASIAALADRLHGQPIDALINNAGITGDFTAQSLATLDADEFQRVLRVNTYAPLRMAQAFLDAVAASRQKKVIAISSGLGSLWQTPQYAQYSRAYYYAISKAGLNMAMRMLASEAKARGILVGIVTPGSVDTDMQKQYRAASAAAGTAITAPVLSPADSASAVVDFIVGLGPEKSGRFYGYSGAEIPW
jgi:NAD(P)-dependent dehydrogenase (short-subunit alcohol dehydrogenase family)